MPSFYYYITLTGLCSFYAHTFASGFNGSNMKIKTTAEVLAGLGFLSFFTLIIVMFFRVSWWHPVVLFVTVSIIAGVTSPLSRGVIGLLSLVGIVVFNALSWGTIF